MWESRVASSTNVHSDAVATVHVHDYPPDDHHEGFVGVDVVTRPGEEGSEFEVTFFRRRDPEELIRQADALKAGALELEQLAALIERERTDGDQLPVGAEAAEVRS